MADGVYSMYGDVRSHTATARPLQKYPQLYLYFDDVHGMSWAGKNGTGYVMDQLGTLPENVILFRNAEQDLRCQRCRDGDLQRKNTQTGKELRRPPYFLRPARTFIHRRSACLSQHSPLTRDLHAPGRAVSTVRATSIHCSPIPTFPSWSRILALYSISAQVLPPRGIIS